MSIATLIADASLFLAQATAPTTSTAAATPAATQPIPWWAKLFGGGPMLPLMIGVVILYVFMFRSKKRQDREKQRILEEMKRGDQVQTIGGIIGKVVEAAPDKVLVKVDENSNTKIWFARSAIHRVLGEEKADAK